MLARPNRLNSSRDIMRVLRTGRRATVGPFVVYSLASRSKIPRVTVVISKKVDKRAVVRNRCRRRVRESFREFLPHLKPSFDILVYIRQDIRQVEWKKIQQDLRQGCEKIGVWQ